MARENMDTVEAAAYLNKAPRTMARWRAQGIGPPWCRANGSILYRKADCDAWLERHRVVPVRESLEDQSESA